MVDIPVDTDCLIIFAGAVIGSVKASIELDREKKCAARLLDIVLGVFCGATVAFHFHTQNSGAVSGLLALVGGVSGATIVEVVLQMLPGVVKKFIKAWVDSKTR